MCGIFLSNDVCDESELHRWMKFRGSDSISRVNCSDGITLHHSLMSVSSAGDHVQPIQAKDCLISYNGEIYNYLQLAQELSVDHRIEISTLSETEVVAMYIEKKGLLAFATRASGMWAVVCYNSKSKKVTFGRDYYGQKPLYYSLDSGAISVGSQYSYFKSVGKNDVDEDALECSRVFGFLTSERTPLVGVLNVQRGSVFEYDIQKKSLSKFLYCRSAKDSEGLAYSTVHGFRPVVAFSGGVDSSYVADCTSKLVDYDIVGVATPECEDEIYSSAALLRLSPPHVIPFEDKDYETAVRSLCGWLVDPVFDPGSPVFLHLMKYCSLSTRVVLGGDGGDEIFFGYSRMRKLSKIEFVMSCIPLFPLRRIMKFLYLFSEIGRAHV